MTTRRSFLGYLAGIFAAVTGAQGQKAILENGQAVVCKEESVTCPVCKQKTCKVINAPIVIGNDSREYSDYSQLYDFHILRCENCHAAFFRE